MPGILGLKYSKFYKIFIFTCKSEVATETRGTARTGGLGNWPECKGSVGSFSSDKSLEFN